MRKEDFGRLLSQLQQLTPTQRMQPGEALIGVDRRHTVAAVIDGSDVTPPDYPHCRAEGARPWGYASGLRRFRCGNCRKTFNRLTGTKLARLRRRFSFLPPYHLRCLLHRPFHALSDKAREGRNVLPNAGAFERGEISVTVFDPDDSPRITA